MTEDADLGIRLHRCGYRVGFVNSVTYEEANNDADQLGEAALALVQGLPPDVAAALRAARASSCSDIGLRRLRALQRVRRRHTGAGAHQPGQSWVLVLLWFTVKPDFIQEMMWPPVYYVGLAIVDLRQPHAVLPDAAGCL